MSLKHKSTKGLLWTFIESFGIRIFSVSSYFVLAGILNAKDFGLLALANTFIQFTNVFIDFGLTASIIQREKVDEEHLCSTFWGSLAIGIVLFIAGILSAPLFASVYRNDELIDIIRVLSLVFIITGASKVQSALLQKAFNFKAIAFANFIGVTTSTTAAIILALNDYGVWSLVVQQMIAVGMSQGYFWMSSKWRPKFIFSYKHFKEIFGFGYKFLFTNILYFINRYACDLLIGYFFGTQLLGYFSFAFKIYNTVVDLILLAITKVTFPLFSSLQSDKEKFRYAFRTICLSTCYITSFAFTLTGLLGPALVGLVFGAKWELSVPLLQYLSIGGIFLFIYWITDNAVLSLGNPNKSIRLNFYSGLLTIAIIVLLGHMHFNAVALVFLLKNFLLMPLLFSFIKNYIGITAREYVSVLIKPFLITAVSASTVYAYSLLAGTISIVDLVAQAAIALVVYLLGICLLDKYMLNVIRSVVLTKLSSKSKAVLR